MLKMSFDHNRRFFTGKMLNKAYTENKIRGTAVFWSLRQYIFYFTFQIDIIGTLFTK